ncbi:lysosomal alpha-mannosidase-like isoform X2 [Ornithodoros turicata]
MAHLTAATFLLAIITSVLQAARGDTATCLHHKFCPKPEPDKLNIHFVCHSHNDAGWLQTVDELFRGPISVIYNSTVEALLANPARQYISAENVFFSRWFKSQLPPKQEQISHLVYSGQLQFVGGGWTQNDEATTHYTAIIDQLTLGLRFLNDTFGRCGRVKVGWQIDPFGHSQAQASIFAQMGYDGQFLGRVSRWEYYSRSNSKGMEFIWKTSSIRGRPADIFTGINYNLYHAPGFLCVTNTGCYMDKSPKGLDETGKSLLSEFETLSNVYSTNNIMVTIGDDMSFQRAHKWFEQVDYTVNAINTAAKQWNYKARAYYSTPACYMAALYQANMSWPVRRGDLFPFGDHEHRYWTGFYTSRPNLKFYARYANGFLQACKQLSVLRGKYDSRVDKLKEAVAILQHHDAITGTSKRSVAEDYRRMLWGGIQACEEVMREAMASLMYQDDQHIKDSLSFCHALNISECFVSESNRAFTVVIYNPFAHEVTHYVRLPITRNYLYEVLNHKGEKIPSQNVLLDTGVRSIPERRSTAEHELVFSARLPALGYSTFYAALLPIFQETNTASIDTTSEETYISNDFYDVEMDQATGLIRQITIKRLKADMRLQQSFYLYNSSGYNSELGNQPGAYVFNPDKDTPHDLGGKVSFRVIKGPEVQEIQQIFNEWITQVVRLYKDRSTIEFEWVVGPLPIGYGSDIVTRYESDIANNGVFYTDSNGMQDVKRSLAASSKAEPTASSYYPVTSWIYIQDQQYDVQMTVVTDRAQGGTSIDRGCIELMVHRQHVTDDHLGLEETLNDRGADGKGIIVRGKHFLHVGNIEESRHTIRNLALRQVYRPVTMFSMMPGGHIPTTHYSALQEPMPIEAHLLTLESVRSEQVIIRLEHHLLQNALNVTLSNLLKPWLLTNIQETLLGANEYKRERLHLDWKQYVRRYSGQHLTALVTEGAYPMGSKLLVALHPGQIRTFLVELVPREARESDPDVAGSRGKTG